MIPIRKGEKWGTSYTLWDMLMKTSLGQESKNFYTLVMRWLVSFCTVWLQLFFFFFFCKLWLITSYSSLNQYGKVIAISRFKKHSIHYKSSISVENGAQ